MFFLRNINRRLVTGFSLALGLVVALTVAGSVGLLLHQGAIDDLQYVLEEGPDRNRLFNSFADVKATANIHVDLSDDQAVETLRTDVTNAVDASLQEVEAFHEAIEEMKLPPTEEARQILMARQLVYDKTRTMYHDLQYIKMITTSLAELTTTDESQRQEILATYHTHVDKAVTQLNRAVNALPAYRDPQFLFNSLEREKRYSRRLLIALLCIAAGTMVSIIIMWYCGFKWVSNPLREISNGASRIAEGDPDFRIARVSRWEDEFSQLRTNVNLMADRFQEAERDLNRKVRERSQQLIRSDRVAGLGFLAAGVAHEINNPLSIIRVAADILDYRLQECLTDNEDKEEIFERIRMVRAEAARCGEITARILDFARGEQATPQVDDITGVIQSVLAMVRPMPNYRDRNIVFERTTPLRLLMNAAEMKQVILNLVFNALQATQEGGRVEIRLIEQCDWVVIEVEDDGCGMSIETMEQLFEPFYSTKPTGQGTGLGMCITHRIIEDHQGTIEPLSPGDGQGSLFRVRLPLRQRNRDVA